MLLCNYVSCACRKILIILATRRKGRGYGKLAVCAGGPKIEGRKSPERTFQLHHRTQTLHDNEHTWRIQVRPIKIPRRGTPGRNRSSRLAPRDFWRIGAVPEIPDRPGR